MGHAHPDRPALRGFTCVRYGGKPPASIPHLLAARTARVSRRRPPSAVCLWLLGYLHQVPKGTCTLSRSSMPNAPRSVAALRPPIGRDRPRGVLIGGFMSPPRSNVATSVLAGCRPSGPSSRRRSGLGSGRSFRPATRCATSTAVATKELRRSLADASSEVLNLRCHPPHQHKNQTNNQEPRTKN